MEDLNIPVPPSSYKPSQNTPLYAGKDVFRNSVGGIAGNYKAGEFNFTMKQGFDPYKYRAQDQGFGESLVKTLGNSVMNFATGLGEMAGYAGALVSEWGDDKDYSNALTETMKSMKNPFGEVYRENPEAMVDIADSAWWLNTFGELATSVATFAVPGMGLAKVFGTAAKAAALAMDGTRAAKFGMTTARLLKAGDAVARTASAASLAYAEGAMSGLAVYEKTYDAQYRAAIKDGKDEGEAIAYAKDRASNAASTTVQINTILNTGLNVIQMMPFFHNADDAVARFAREEGKMVAGETADKYAARMRNFIDSGTNAQNYLKGKYRPFGVLGESLSESLEELNNQFAEKTGYAVGESGKKAGAFSQLKEIENYFDRTMDAEGAYAASLGFIGGAGTTVFTDYVPLHRIEAVGADGKAIPKVAADGKDEIDPKTGKTVYKKTFVNGITRRYNGQVDRLNSIADSLAKDAEWFGQKQTEMKQAVVNNDPVKAAQLRMEMMDVTNLSAVSRGMGESVKEMYSQVADVDNTKDVGAEQIAAIDKQLEEAQSIEDENERVAQLESLAKQREKAEKLQGQTSAMIAGLTSSKEDNDYKKMAARAGKRIDLIQEAYNEAENDYSFDTSDKETGVMEYMFQKKAYAKLLAHNITNVEEDLNEARAKYNTLSRANIDRDSIEAADAEQAKAFVAGNRTMAKLREDYDTINVLKNRILAGTATDQDRKQFTSVMQTYGAIATGSITGDTEATAIALKKEADRINASLEDVKSTYSVSIGYETWAKDNAGKTIDDYFNMVNEQFSYSDRITNLQDNLEKSKSQLTVVAAQMQALEKKGLKKLREVMKSDLDEVMAKEKARVQETIKDTQNAAIAAKINANNKELERLNAIKGYDSEIATLQGELKTVSNRLTGLKAKHRWMVDKYLDGTWNTIRDLTTRLANINARIEALKEAKYAEEQTVIPEPGPVPVGATPEESGADEDAPVPEEVEVEESVLSEEVVLQQIENWKSTVRSKNMYLTIPELKELLKAATLDKLSEEQLDNIVNDNLVFVRDTVTTPAESMEEVLGYVKDMPLSLQQETYEAIQELFLAQEDPRSEVMSDSEILSFMTDAIPALAGVQALPFFANKVKQTIESMHQEELMFIELMEQVKIMIDTRRANEEYEVTEPPIEEPAPFTGSPLEVPMPAEGFDTQPAVTKDAAREADKSIHIGLKSKGATHLAASTLEYTEDKMTENGADKFFFVNKRNSDGSLKIDPVSENLLDPGVAAVGTPIKLVVERGTENETGFNSLGKVDTTSLEAVGSFPIAMYDMNGNKLGYVHTTAWIRQSRVASASSEDQFRNIAGDEADVKEAEAAVLGIRNFVANNYNRLGDSMEIQTTVKSKGNGITNLHTIQEAAGQRPRTVEWSAEKALPDTSLQIGVILGGKVKTKWNEEIDATSLGIPAEELSRMNGQSVAILPSANGGFTYATLYRSDLAPDGENSPAYRTVVRLFELFLNQENTDEVKKIEEETGHNILTGNGLKALVNEQFTETSLIKDIDLTLNPAASKKMMIQITPTAITIGKHGSGQSALSVNHKQQMSEKFKQQLLNILVNRLRVASIENKKLGTRGLNSEGDFKAITLGKDGSWNFRPFKSYNEFFKSNTTTFADGTAKDSKGNYRYTSNPKIEINIPTMKVVAKPDTPIVAVAQTPQEDTDLEDDLGFFSGDIKFKEIYSVSMDAVENEDSTQVLPLTEELLTRLYNELPANQRNGKTVEDVKKERISLGYTFMVIGDNPFRRCS